MGYFISSKIYLGNFRGKQSGNNDIAPTPAVRYASTALPVLFARVSCAGCEEGHRE
jgi:hypothetical protein